jgi:hypothetical protein
MTDRTMDGESMMPPHPPTHEAPGGGGGTPEQSGLDFETGNHTSKNSSKKPSYQEVVNRRKGWSDIFMDEVLGLMDRHVPLWSVAPAGLDRWMAMDLVVRGLQGAAVRVRRRTRLQDFTIRHKGRQDPVELQKLLQGHPQWMFCGGAQDGDQELRDWFIGDLRVWTREYANGRWSPSQVFDNDDGTGALFFKLSDGPDNFIIARKGK